MKLKTIILIILLPFVFLLGLKVGESEVSKVENVYQAFLTLRTEMCTQLIKSEQTKYTDLKRRFDTLVSEFDEIKALRDSGINLETEQDVDNLTKILKQLDFISPFKGGFTITSKFGYRAESIRIDGVQAREFHLGIDIIPNSNDNTIYAPTNGAIVDFGTNNIDGKYIIFEIDNGHHRLKFTHLKTIFWQNVETHEVLNIPVQQGRRLGIMGETGWTHGVHLHLEVMIYIQDETSARYEYVNPTELFRTLKESENEIYIRL